MTLRSAKRKWGKSVQSSTTNALATFAMPLRWKMFATCPVVTTNSQATAKGNGLATLTNLTVWFFEPHEKPIPADEDRKYIWLEIKGVEITEIANYHGK